MHTIKATAKLLGTQLQTVERFPPPIELTQENINRIINEAEERKVEDEEAVRRAEIENRANAAIRKAEERLKKHGGNELSAAVAKLGLALQSTDLEEIRNKTTVVEESLGTMPIADMPFYTNFGSLFDLHAQPSPNVKQKAKEKAHPQSQPVASHEVVKLGTIFGGGKFTLDAQLCFVLMPFAGKFQEIYDDHVRRVIEAAGLKCQRADDLPGTNLITWDIWDRINRARFLVAELTDQNPNVFYELGLAHALSKEVVLITQSMDFVPFDLKALRCIVYEFTPRGIKALEERLRVTVDLIMKSA